MKKNILFIIALYPLLTCPLSSSAQWERVFGISAGNIRCLAASDSNIFAATFQNGVILSKDNGNNWEEINNGFGADTFILSLAIKNTTVYAGTSTGNVFLSGNNGASWTIASNGLINDGIVALAVNDSTVFAGTLANGVYVSSDNGTNWTRANNGLTDSIISSLVVSGSNIFAGIYGGGVFLSTDNAQNWSAANNGLTDSIVYSVTANGSNIFAGTLNKGVFFSPDNGSTWTQADSGLPATNVLSVAAVGSSMLAGTSNKGVYISGNNGSTWSAFNDGLTGYTSCFFISFAFNNTYIFTGTQSTENGIWRRSLSDATAVENMSDNNHLGIYPNPASNRISFIMSPVYLKKENVSVYVTNVLGARVLASSAFQRAGEIVTLDISSLSSGIYFMEVNGVRERWAGKFIKE